MTSLGKILVLINLAISLVFMSWAIALFTQPPEYAKNAKEGEVPKLTQRGEEIKQLLLDRNQAQQLYADAVASLTGLEKQRKINQGKFLADLRMMDTGLDAAGQTVEQPVKGLATDSGVVKVDATGYPLPGDAITFNDKSLKALNFYLAESETTLKTIEEKRVVIKQAINESEKLNKEINDKAGLRDQIAELQRRYRNAVEEELYLRPIVYNRQVEKQLLVNRRAQLEARQKELESAPKERAASR